MNKPKQKCSFNEKKKEEWKKATADYYRERCVPAVYDIDEYNKLYQFASGEIDEVDYTHVVNPYNVKTTTSAGFPSKMKNMDIISPSYQMIIAEKRQRSSHVEVLPINGNGEKEKQEKVFQLYYEGLKQFYVNKLVELGIAEEDMAKQPPSKDMIEKKASSIPNEMAIQGSDALEYIKHYNELPHNFIEGFKDYLVCGQVFSYKDIKDEEIHYEIVPAGELYYLKDSCNIFLEDSEAVLRRKLIGIQDAIEMFRDVEGFTKELEEDLEARVYRNQQGSTFSPLTYASNALVRKASLVADEYENPDNIEVEHLVFKSWTKVYKVRTIDLYGNSVEEIFSEFYIPDDFEDYEEMYVREFYEMYIIDGRYYIGLSPIEATRAKMDKPDACKNLYNGRVFKERFTRSNSFIKKGLNYQYKFNVVYWQLEKVLAKNKDKIIVMPLELIPDEAGYDEFTTMYYADAHGYIFVDTDGGDNKKLNALNGLKILDAGLSQHISALFDILDKIKSQWEETVGISQQRKGAVANSAGKGVTQEAIFRSSMMSENIFAEFEEFELREYQGLMDLSKHAWYRGKKTMFRSSDGRNIMLMIDPNKYANCEYGVFADNSAEIRNIKQQIKEIAFARAQNDGPTSEAIEMIRANNITGLVQHLKRLEEEAQQRAEQQASAEREQLGIIEAKKAELKERELALKKYDIDADVFKAIEVARIQEGSKLMGLDANKNNVNDYAEVLKASNERTKQFMELQFRNKELEIKQNIEKDKIEATKYVADTNLKIAKENKNKHDK
jgi:hypothetical protein